MPFRAPLALLLITIVATALGSSAPRHIYTGRAEPIETNDNVRAAGSLQRGVLTLNLEARIGTWHPHGPRITGANVPALGEVRRQLQIPSPMIRVPAGTEVVVTVRNTLHAVLAMHGLVARPVRGTAEEPVHIAPGATREIRFRLDEPGTYYYWGTTMGRTFAARTKEDAQINGAIIVDPPNVRRPRDRVLLMSGWSDTTPSPQHRDGDMRQLLLVINGRSWPNTERLSATVGDTVQWRVINATASVHPMHLHGFYFRVDARGDGMTDSVYADGGGDLAVTERMVAGHTMAMSWVPERPGNWLFHCHLTAHFAPRGPLGLRIDERDRIEHAGHSGNHAEDGMSGLVMGVSVAPRRTGSRTLVDDVPRRRLRLVLNERGQSTARAPMYGVTIHEAGPEPVPLAEGPLAGPPLVLERGVHAEITVVNRTGSPTAIHWHGIELESYFDGVPGFSGSVGRISPLIAAGDSFRVRMIPPRAGTFIYHTHADELRQQPAGLSGPLIVVEPESTRDPATDIAILISSPRDSADERRAVLLNGHLRPPPLELRAGVRHRLRLINITTARPQISVELRRGAELGSWRALAKDGADLPDERQVMERASQVVSIGETYDVELTPAEPGDHRLEVRNVNGAVLATMPVVVR